MYLYAFGYFFVSCNIAISLVFRVTHFNSFVCLMLMHGSVCMLMGLTFGNNSSVICMLLVVSLVLAILLSF